MQLSKVGLLDNLNCKNCCMANAPAGNNTLFFEAFYKSVSEIRGRSVPRHANVGYLLTFSVVSFTNRPVPIKITTNKSPSIFFRYLRKVFCETFIWSQSQLTHPIRYLFRCKSNVPGLPFVLRSNTVRHFNERLDHRQHFIIVRCYVDSVAIQMAVTPNQSECPCQLIRPFIEKGFFKREAENRLGQSGGPFAAELSSPTHICFVAYQQSIARLIKQRGASLTAKFTHFVCIGGCKVIQALWAYSISRIHDNCLTYTETLPIAIVSRFGKIVIRKRKATWRRKRITAIEDAGQLRLLDYE